MAIKNLIRKEFYHLRWIIIVGLLLSAGTAALAVFSFHYMAQIVEEIPGELLEMLSQYEVTRELLHFFGDYSVYIWSQWHAKNLFQLASLIVIIMAATQFAGEVGGKTISFYLTRPISRRQGFAGKVAAGLLILFLLISGGTAIIWLASTIMGYTAEWGRFFIASAINLVWVTVFYLLACIISTMHKEAVLAGVMTGLCGILLSLPGLFPSIRHLSIFYQMRALDYYLLHQPLLSAVIPGVAAAVLLALAGLCLFNKKDF